MAKTDNDNAAVIKIAEETAADAAPTLSGGAPAYTEKNAPAAAKKPPAAALYSAAELAAAARAKFGAAPEVVAAALGAAGVDKTTFAEARKLVDEFKGKKVRAV